jgi:predicted RNA-binding Zn ribbon-like protein
MARNQFPRRVAGRLSLDFVNTVDPRGPVEGREYLSDYQALLDWCEFAELSLPRSTSWLRRSAKAEPRAAVRAHTRAIAMREALYAVINSSRLGATVRRPDLAELNQALGESIGHRVLTPDERGGVGEGWRSSDELTQVLWPMAIDAWDLLTEPELGLVRQCPLSSGGCGWLFLDASRAGNRRWCDMRTCGNRAKVRAHYSRTAQAQPSSLSTPGIDHHV